MMAAAEVLARYYRRRQVRIDRAVRAGASWEQVAAEVAISAAQARQEYRDWAGQQHVRSGNPNPCGLGMAILSTSPLWPAPPSPRPVSDRRDERLALDGVARRPAILLSWVSLATACLTRWPKS
jgi:hypothetical protein